MKKIGELKQIITKEIKKNKEELQKKIDEAKEYGKKLEAKKWKVKPESKKDNELIWKWTYFK